MSQRHNLAYTIEQIDLYRAVLYREALRCGVDVQDKKALSLFSMMAAGVNGKSALLDRIVSGKSVFVIPPPVAMSYPWYGIVENENAKPIDLWLDAGDGFELMKQAQQYCASIAKALDKVADKAESQPLGETSRQKSLRSMASHTKGAVMLEQGCWQVLSISKDGMSLEVTQPEWFEQGYIWGLSLEALPASESSTVMCSWHDRSIARITTIDQLRKEKRWHVMKHVQALRVACDEALATQAMAEAMEKDRQQSLEHGVPSRFNESSTRSSLGARRAVVQDRLDKGLPAVPDQAEIEKTIQESIDRCLSPADRAGSGWYSVRADGALMHHGWRIRRLTNKTVPPQLVLDLKTLQAAPPDFLSQWRLSAVDHPDKKRAQSEQPFQS